MIAETPDPEALLEGYRRAEARRRPWEALWRDCAAHALPYGTEGAARIYDATAADASDQLAASLLAELTPPFQRWVGFEPGSEAGPDASETLEDAAGAVQGHLDRSAFAVEMHQALLDLAVLGTGCLLFEESALGQASAFRFTAVPLTETVLEEGPEGRLDRVWRRRELGPAALRARFPRVPRNLAGRGAVRRRRVRGAGGWRRRRRQFGAGRRRRRQFDDSPRYARRRPPLPRRAGRRRRAAGADAGRGPVRRLALHLLPLAEGAGRGLWPLAGDEGAARHQDRRQGGGTHPEERLHRRDRHLAGGRRRRARPLDGGAWCRARSCRRRWARQG